MRFAPHSPPVDREVVDVAVAGDRDVEVADLLGAAGGEHAGAGLDGDAHVEVGATALAQRLEAGGAEVALGPGRRGVAAQDGVDVDGGVLAGAIEALGPEGDGDDGAGAQVAAVLKASDERRRCRRRRGPR
jgi:hypothetical protein